MYLLRQSTFQYLPVSRSFSLKLLWSWRTSQAWKSGAKFNSSSEREMARHTFWNRVLHVYYSYIFVIEQNKEEEEEEEETRASKKLWANISRGKQWEEMCSLNRKLAIETLFRQNKVYLQCSRTRRTCPREEQEVNMERRQQSRLKLLPNQRDSARQTDWLIPSSQESHLFPQAFSRWKCHRNQRILTKFAVDHSLSLIPRSLHLFLLLAITSFSDYSASWMSCVVVKRHLVATKIFVASKHRCWRNHYSLHSWKQRRRRDNWMTHSRDMMIVSLLFSAS